MPVPTKYSIGLAGEGSVTRLNKEVTFTVDEKLEKTITITNETETIDYSFITSPKLFIFEGTGSFVVSVTHDGSTIDFEITDSWTFMPTASFMANVTDITLKETLGNEVTINVRIYSEVL